MPLNHLTTEQRQELGRRTQAKLRARIAAGTLPADYFRQLGRKGFRVTLQKYGSERVAQLLSRYYGHAVQAKLLGHEGARARELAATRRAYPLVGQACARCGGPAESRDHVLGWQAGHAPGLVQLLCNTCHRAMEVARIKEAS
jgi:hypothetical protein